MAHTRNQELESRFNTLQSGLLETQQEVQQLSATIASRDASMNASVNVAVQSAMAEVKHELTTSWNLSLQHSAPNSSSLPMTLFLRHIKKLKVKLLPIPFNPITFKGTYAFCGWM
jgi:hypothetical protein